MATLRDLLRNSRTHKFVEANRAVYSAVRAAQNRRNNAANQRPTAVKCWIFKK